MSGRQLIQRAWGAFARSGFLSPKAVTLAIIAIMLVSACGNPEKEKLNHYRKGSILAQRGRYAEAVVEYQKALTIDPQMAEAQYELGQCYGKLQYYEQAVRAFDTARALDPRLALEALLQIADIYASSARPALAGEMCHDALEIDSDNVDAMALLGRLKWKEKKADEAGSWFEKVLTIDPNHVESRMTLAEIAVLEGRYDAAEEHLKKVTTEIDPTDSAAKLALAKIYRFSNREDEAIKTLGQILENDPTYFRARGALAEAYYSVGRLDDARNEAEAFLEASPGNTQAHFLLGTISLRQGDYESAVFHLTKAANSPAALADAHYLLGLALKGKNQRAQATAAFQKALAMEPDNSQYRLMLAQTFLVEGSFEKAQREISAVLSKEPENEYARQLWVQANALQQSLEHIDSLLASEGIPEEIADSIKMGLKALRAGDLRRAQSLCEDSLKAAPDSPLLLNLLGLVYLKQSEFERALSYFLQASNADPQFAASYVNMANIYMAIGSHEQAVQAYRKAVEHSPKDRLIRLRFIRALVLMKRYDAAEAFLKELIQAEPHQVAHRLALANLLISKNRYADARKELSLILKTEPKNALAAQLLAETLAMEGDAATAAAQFDTLLRAFPASRSFRVKLALCNLVLGGSEKAQEILAARPDADEETPPEEVVRALVMQEQGLSDQAEEILLGLQTAMPEESVYGLMLANARASRGDLAGGTESLGRNSGLSDSFRKNYAQLLQAGSLDAAELNELSRAIALTQFRWNRLGIQKLEEVLRKAGPNAALLEIVGGLWEKEGQPDKAALSYQSAVAADPSYWPAYHRLGVQSLHAGQAAQAEQYLKSALKYQPNSPALLLNLARAFETGGNGAEALKTYRKINELHPNLAPVMNNLAWLLAKSPDTLDQALEYARLAVAAQPLKAEVRDTLGWILFQKGDYKAAKEQLDKAVLFDSLNPSIRYHRGMAHLRLDDRAEALEDFKKAGAATTPFPERQLNENMIRELS
jgi:tetratricopeptide (TPR) repeat protein